MLLPSSPVVGRLLLVRLMVFYVSSVYLDLAVFMVLAVVYLALSSLVIHMLLYIGRLLFCVRGAALALILMLMLVVLLWEAVLVGLVWIPLAAVSGGPVVWGYVRWSVILAKVYLPVLLVSVGGIAFFVVLFAVCSTGIFLLGHSSGVGVPLNSLLGWGSVLGTGPAALGYVGGFQASLFAVGGAGVSSRGLGLVLGSRALRALAHTGVLFHPVRPGFKTVFELGRVTLRFLRE